jgi:glycosyltransferase involved in cell wall biosynthesis
LATSCEILRFRYGPRAWSSLTGRHGILENVRERPWRAVLVPAFLWALSTALQRELERDPPDRVAAHMLLPCGLAVARVCSRRGIPFELFGHGTDADVLLRLPEILRRRCLASMSDARKWWLPSEDKLERVRACLLPGRGPLALGVETLARFVPTSAEVETSDEGRAREGVVFLGRLIAQKGVDDLVEAVSLLPRETPLHVGGEGPELPRLRRLARRLGVDARFHGFVEGAAKTRLLLGARVMCVPSRTTAAGLSEGAPLSLVEGLHHGLSVVATAVGGIPELARGHRTVTLVEPDNPRALAVALARALAPA